jgi:hypothetical protein
VFNKQENKLVVLDEEKTNNHTTTFAAQNQGLPMQRTAVLNLRKLDQCLKVILRA